MASRPRLKGFPFHVGFTNFEAVRGSLEVAKVAHHLAVDLSTTLILVSLPAEIHIGASIWSAIDHRKGRVAPRGRSLYTQGGDFVTHSGTRPKSFGSSKNKFLVV